MNLIEIEFDACRCSHCDCQHSLTLRENNINMKSIHYFDLMCCFPAVKTLPIILDISKTIRLIFCALYKLTEPERRADAEAIRQRRLGMPIMFHS
jgi:hypothetical protein